MRDFHAACIRDRRWADDTAFPGARAECALYSVRGGSESRAGRRRCCLSCSLVFGFVLLFSVAASARSSSANSVIGAEQLVPLHTYAVMGPRTARSASAPGKLRASSGIAMV